MTQSSNESGLFIQLPEHDNIFLRLGDDLNIVNIMVRKTMSDEEITKDMSIGEVVVRWPETAGTFLEWGLACYGCAVARFENIEQGAIAHGIDPDALVKALNETIREQ